MSRHRSPVSGFFGLRRPARTAIDSFPGSRMAPVRRDDLEVRAGATFLRARALQPDPAVAWVLLAHAGMPDLQARQVAERLAGDGYATLQLDLGTGRVVDTLDAAADLGEQTRAAMAWLRGQTFFDARQMALLGLRDAAPAALWAAGEGPELAGPVVAGGHRPDLAGARLRHIVAPTLLVSPGSAAETLGRHRQALAQLRGACQLQMGRGPEGWTDAGACELAWLAGCWFERHLCVSRRPMMAEPLRAWGLLRRAGAHRRELRVAMALAFLGWLVLPRTVRAAVTSGVSGGVLTATSDGADGIVVTCTGGNVKINGADPGTGPEVCASITQVVLTGGPGANVISFTATSATFPSVTGATIDGGAGNDVLTGSSLNDTIRGGSGADSIVGGLGDDSLDGGSADTAFDRVSASGGSNLVLSNTLLTGVGTDTLSGFERASLSGTAGNDTLDASAFTLGPVTLNGAAGNDTLLGSPGSDFLSGGLGDDSYAGGAGSDQLSEAGGGGNDTFGGDAGTDRVTEVPTDVDQMVTDTALTGPGTNVLSSIEGVSLTGGPGANRLDGSAFTLGSVQLYGAAGNDTLLGSPGSDFLSGGLGDDSYAGGAGNDILSEVGDGGGNDTFGGDAGIDRVWEAATDVDQTVTDTAITGPGTNVLSGIEGVTLTGGPGANTLDGSAFTLGSVALDGAAGNDTLVGSPANDVLMGGLGDDSYAGGAGTDRVTEVGTDVDQTVTNTAITGPGTNVLSSIETVSLTGGPGANRLDGSAFTLGSVALAGAAGNDTLLGSAGDDVLRGGLGDDSCDAGAGNDRFEGRFDGGNDTLKGGRGFDDYQAPWVDSDFVVTNSSVTGPSTVALESVEWVNVNAGPSNNRLDASAFTAGYVWLDGFEGDDTLIGSSGDDVLFGGPGNNIVQGGAGNDIAWVYPLTNAPFAAVLTPDTLTASDRVDQLTSIERAGLEGRDGADSLDASAFTGDVSLNGGNGNDTLTGGSGNDMIDGDENGDSNTLIGNAGDDTFFVDATAQNTVTGGGGLDRIDFRDQDQAFTRTGTGVTVGGTEVVSVTDSVELFSNDGVSAISFLAEGATGAFFDLDVAIGNPNLEVTPVTVTYLREDGVPTTQTMDLPPQSRTTIRVDNIAAVANNAVATTVESQTGQPILVERTMFWDATSYAGHTGSAVEGPRRRWLFAEGSQGFFDTWVLLQNPNAAAANVTVQFNLEDGTTVIRSYQVGPTSRFNVFTGAIPELVGRSFAMVVDADAGIIAERAMYFGGPRMWEGGHESAGIPEASTSWFLAEGATGSFFDTYVLVGNPNASPAEVTFTYLLETGETVTKTRVMAPNSRLTVNLENEDPTMANAAVSTTVSSDVPVVAERAMYWPGDFTSWAEAHNSPGLTGTGTKGGLAEGRVGQALGFETYILLANPDARAATVKITYLRTSGAPIEKTYTVNPTTRFNVYVNGMVPELANEDFAAVIEVTNGVPIAAERALYWNSGGQTWAGGTNAVPMGLP